MQSAKLLFIIAVMLLVAKPFLGFSMFSRIHPPAAESIFVKAFTKRKQEYVEDSSYDVIAVQKKLADHVDQLFLRFSFLLNILFPSIFYNGLCTTSRFLRDMQLNLVAPRRTFIRNSKLII
jgi:hypothetical protein